MAASLTAGTIVALTHGVRKVPLTWVSASDGTVSLTFTLPGGELLHMVTDPDGSAAPTDNYDIEILDPLSVDILGGNGANRDTANNEAAAPAISRRYCEAGTYTLSVTNAGDTKGGVITLDVR